MTAGQRGISTLKGPVWHLFGCTIRSVCLLESTHPFSLPGLRGFVLHVLFGGSGTVSPLHRDSCRTTCGSSAWFPCQTRFLTDDGCFHLTLLETLALPLRPLLAVFSKTLRPSRRFICWSVSQREMRGCLERRGGVDDLGGDTHSLMQLNADVLPVLQSGKRGMACVSASDLFISFHSGCLHTKRLLSPIFLSISHPLLFPPSSPFPVCPSLFTCVF